MLFLTCNANPWKVQTTLKATGPDFCLQEEPFLQYSESCIWTVLVLQFLCWASMHVSATESCDGVGNSTGGKTCMVTEQGDSRQEAAAFFSDKPTCNKHVVCVFLILWLLAWMLKGALTLQVQAGRNEEEKRERRLFSDKQAYLWWAL